MPNEALKDYTEIITRACEKEQEKESVMERVTRWKGGGAERRNVVSATFEAIEKRCTEKIYSYVIIKRRREKKTRNEEERKEGDKKSHSGVK